MNNPKTLCLQHPYGGGGIKITLQVFVEAAESVYTGVHVQNKLMHKVSPLSEHFSYCGHTCVLCNHFDCSDEVLHKRVQIL